MIGILILVAVILSVLLSWILLMKDRKCYNIPGPIPLPIVGNGHLFLGKPTNFLPIMENLRNTYGDAVHIHLLHEPYVILYHPKYYEPLLTHGQLITKGNVYKHFKEWLGSGLISATGNRWRTHRKLLTPAFHIKMLHNYLPVFLNNEKILVRQLKTAYCNNEAVNIYPIVALTALDNVTESIMGVSIRAQENCNSKYVKYFCDIKQIISLRMWNSLLGQDVIFRLTSYKKTFDEALKTLQKYAKDIIELRKKELKDANITTFAENSESEDRNKNAFIDLLLLSDINGKKVKEEHILEEVSTFIYAGHDTSTVAISFILYCISKYPHVQERILEEQKAILGDDLNRDPSYSEVQQMKYLELVIKETMRIFPPVPIIGRLITEDCELAGLRLKKNTTVVIDILHMHRNPELFDNPMEFRPERFESITTNSAKNAMSWIPFSAGPRNCIGQKFAMLEIKVTVAAVVKNFKLLPVDMDLRLCSDIVLRSVDGLKIKLLHRDDKEL